MKTTQTTDTLVTEAKARQLGLLEQLKAAKAAHMDAWKASQEATRTYNAIKAQYWAECQALEAAKKAA